VAEVLADTGVLVTAQMAGEMADALLELLEHSELRYDMARKGQRRALAKFTLNRVSEAYQAIYQDLFTPASVQFDDPVLLLTQNGSDYEDVNSLLLYEEEGLL
jgi:hypothetical protein